MNFEETDIFYFSGTGNTFLVMQKIKKVLEEKGVDVDTWKIEETDPNRSRDGRTIGLMFPVAVHTTYPFVWNFIKNLPDSTGEDVFMVSTLAGSNSRVEKAVGKKLKKKGYNLLASTEITMPSNFFIDINEEVSNEKLMSEGLSEAEEYAEKLVNGEESWNTSFRWSDFVSALSKTKTMWWLLRKIYRFRVDENGCNRCGLCERLCPIDNIRIEEHAEFNGNCEKCMRCISFCPNDAIKTNKDFEPYSAVDPSRLLQ